MKEALSQITVLEEGPDLEQYQSIPISFEVRSKFEVCEVPGSERFDLVETPGLALAAAERDRDGRDECYCDPRRSDVARAAAAQRAARDATHPAQATEDGTHTACRPSSSRRAGPSSR